jgi:predicted alpha/beta-fold hydrolase
MANIFFRKNCRVFCFNARGSKLPPTTNVFSHIGLTSDIRYILKHYANCVTNFLAEYEDKQRIRMGVSVCCPFDFYKLRSMFQKTSFYKRLINYVMTRDYKRYIKKSTVDRLCFNNTTFLHEVDAKLLEITGIDMSDDFYKQNSCVRILDKIDKPFLFLNSSDDPVIPENIIPFDTCKRNKNISLIILKGGHLCFFTNGKETMAKMIVERYFDIVTAQTKLLCDD